MLATQPLDGSFEFEEGGPPGATWRWCEDLTVHLPRLAIKQKMFRLGWAKIRAVISKSDKGGSKWLNAVSKC